MSNDSSDEAHSVAPARKWGVGGIFLGLIAFVAPQVLIGGIAFSLAGERNLTNSEQFLAYGLGSVVTLGLLLQILQRYKATFRDLGLGKVRVRYVGYALAALPVYLLISGLVAQVTTFFMPKIDLNQVQDVGFQQVSQNPLQLLMIFIALVILPPIVEELLFRGLIFKGTLKYARPVIGAIITSLLFGVAHGQWNVGIDTFSLSLVLCFLVYKTNSLWPSIFLHGAKNLIAFILVFVTPNLIDDILHIF